jgi:hypothetical protein
MKRKRQKHGLSSWASKHTAAGREAYERSGLAADRVMRLVNNGDCKGAFVAYGALERAYGEAHAHASSGGRAPPANIPAAAMVVWRAEGLFIERCLVGHRKLARGSRPPYGSGRRTLPMPTVSLKGRRR